MIPGTKSTPKSASSDSGLLSGDDVDVATVVAAVVATAVVTAVVVAVAIAVDFAGVTDDC